MSSLPSHHLPSWLTWALGSAQPPELLPRVGFTDGPSAEGRTDGALTVSEYHHAVDQREVRVFARFENGATAVIVAEASGRHVGSLGNLLATGRRFSTLVHVISVGSKQSVAIASGLPRALLVDGVRSLSRASTESARDQASDVLDCETDFTLWARAWSLPPRLAKVSALLICGMQPEFVAKSLGLTLKSTRTYIEALLLKAGVASRAELPLAALSASTYPVNPP